MNTDNPNCKFRSNTQFMNIFCRIAFCVFFIVTVAGCGVTREAGKVSNLSNCDFRIRDVEHVELAGIEFDHVRSAGDLNIGDFARIMGGLSGQDLPLSLQLNIDAHNPNTGDAGLTRLEWVLFIDDVRMTSGTYDKPVNIPANSTLNIPFPLQVNLKELLSGKSATAMLNFCMNLAGDGNKPTRFTIKLKPSIMVGGSMLTYPGYITVKSEYSAKQSPILR